MTDNLVTSPKNLVTRLRDKWVHSEELCYEAADEIERLRSELDEARRGEHRENEHTPTWAELAAYWKARAEELETALSEIASGRYTGVVLPSHPPRDHAVERARAALGEEK